MIPAELIKVHEDGIFGKGTKLTPIQKLFAQRSIFKTLGKVNGDGEASLVDKSNVIQKALEDEIDKATPSPDSPDYNKFLAMKALSCGYQCPSERDKKLPAALKALEPIKFEPEVTLAYLVASLELEAKEENLDYFLRAEALYEHYKTSGTPCLSTYQLFGAIIPFHEEESDGIAMSLFEKFETLKNDAMRAKYVLQALKAIFDQEIALDKPGLKPFKVEEFLPQVMPHIECLITSHHFAQLDHLLSLFMFHLVKNGRTDHQSTERQLMIDSGKAAVSSWYTLWARRLIESAKSMEKNPDYALQNPIRTDLIRFEYLMKPGVEIYEKQFPVDFISNEKEWKKVMKHGKLWCARSVDYFEKRPAVAIAANFYRTSEHENFSEMLKLFDMRNTAKPEFLN